MTSKSSLRIKIRVVGAATLFIAVLTVLIAFAAAAQQGSAGQPSAKVSAASLPVPAGTSAQPLLPLLPETAHTGRALASFLPKTRLGDIGVSGTPLFLPAVTYASGGYDPSVAVADVNGDGKPDLVVSDYNTGVDVLLGNGDGTFQPAVTYPTGYSVLSVAVADVNGDGKPDIAVAMFSSSVAVLLGNGDGTFQPAVIYPCGVTPDSVAIADVNGDNKPDLVLADWTGFRLDVLLGNGDGTFRPAVSYNSGGYVANSAVVADVNGDGKPDLVVANWWQSIQHRRNGTVGVLLGNGDGTFQPVVTYGSGGYGASSVAVADVNRDGKPDLVVANCEASPGSSCYSIGGGHGLVGVLLGNGDGTFQSAVTYDLGGLGAGSVVVADVNGDGKPDLLAVSCGSSSCTSSVGVLLGNGDGTFQSVASYGSGGYGAASVAVADVNGDHKPDLLVATCANSSCSLGGVGVLLNNTTGGKSATSTALVSSLNPSLYGQSVTWKATVTTSGPVPPTGAVTFSWSTYTIGTATLNGSGVATLTKSNLNAYTYPLVAVFKGDGSNLASTSAILNQVVKQTTSAATVTSSPNPSTQGQAVTFTAKITSPTVVPTGPVTFALGNTVLGTAQLSSGKATFTTSTLPVGTNMVTVTYPWNSNIAGSSASVAQAVEQ